MIPRYGEPLKPGMRYRMRPGAYAVLVLGRDILLTWQHGDALPLQLPGGGIDLGEHPIPALRREVMEETGWSIGHPRRLGAFRRFTFMPEYGIWAEKVCAVYLARPVRRHGAPTERDHSEVWMPLDAAAVELDDRVGRTFVAALAAAGETR